MESRSASNSSSAVKVEDVKYQINLPANQPNMENRSSISTSINKDVWSVTKLLDGMIMIYWEVRDSFIQETSIPGKWVSEKMKFLFRDNEYQLNLVFHMNTIRLTLRNLNDETSGKCPFEKVTAFHHGQKTEMLEIGGLWEPVVWPTLASVSEQGIVQPFPVLQVMFEFQPKNTTNTTKLNEKLAHISKLLDFNLLFDVQMVVKGRSFGAHWPILVAASPVMAAFYESGLEGSPKSINIDDMEPEVFEQMLRFMYTGEAPELQEFAEDLFVAAEKYQLKFLKEECEQHLSTDISIDNAVRRLILARDHSSSTLMESSLQFLSKHQEEIWTRPEWEELLTKNPKVFFMASQRICMRGIKRKL